MAAPIDGVAQRGAGRAVPAPAPLGDAEYGAVRDRDRQPQEVEAAVSSTRVAIYWDWENVHARVLDSEAGEGTYRQSFFKPQEAVVDVAPVVEYALTFGPITINRAYANWQWFGRYRRALQEHAIDLVQLFPLTGTKNGADIRLAIDVIEDLQQQRHITHVLVVAGDSDYVGLAQKCRKLGRTVIGVGVDRAASSLVAAFDEFRFYRDLAPSASPSAGAARSLGAGDDADSLDLVEDARALLVKALRGLAAQRGGPWVLKSSVRPMLQRLDPTFTEQAYGFASFDRLLDAVADTVVVRTGAYDHELAVRADLDGAEVADDAAAQLAPPTTVIERQLRKTGLRLPSRPEVFWSTPQVISRLFADHPGGAFTSNQELSAQLLDALRSTVGEVDGADANKMRNIIFRARCFDFLEDGAGIRLAVTDVPELTRRMIRTVVAHLPDVGLDDVDDLVTVLCGPDADARDEARVDLIRDVVLAVTSERQRPNEPESERLDPTPAADTEGAASGTGGPEPVL
jgi:hypothetical protein